jgi:hypothetical protein
MKDFDISEREFLSPLGEPGSTRASLKLLHWTPSPIGWDEEKGEAIYGPVTPEDEEKAKWFRKYRIVATRHTKLEADREKPDDGTQQKAFVSAEFDSREPEAGRKALAEILGALVIVSLGLKTE